MVSRARRSVSHAKRKDESGQPELAATNAERLPVSGSCVDEQQPKHGYGILLFYEYSPVAQVGRAVDELKQICSRLGLSGRIRISQEGFNGNLSGTWEMCQAFP